MNVVLFDLADISVALVEDGFEPLASELSLLCQQNHVQVLLCHLALGRWWPPLDVLLTIK